LSAVQNGTAGGLMLALDDVLEKVAQRAAEIVAERELVEPDRWLDVDQAAGYMACSKQRVYNLVHEGRLTPGRDGRRLLFRRSALDAYLEGR
jgi:excisionase family DNA binding protein